ncbi:hypothetical protein HYALB_00003459 [Hymenoscyphus albidus]|uniref:Uncharacterized protein n=1 Tax=Hymenoscyphus albidus TaxID=595503 RepID=A0A9N9LE67_9HELO|nr:hypothetical protein HYALB_00003459 [Hymenoscyphus albidus]
MATLTQDLYNLGTQILSSNIIFELARPLFIPHESDHYETILLHPASSRLARTALKDSILPSRSESDGLSPIYRLISSSSKRDPSIWENDDEFINSNLVGQWTKKGRTLWG